MKTPPFFTIISVVFNDRPGIERTHKSVASHTCRDFEWLIVDGASRDQTVEYIRGIQEPALRWVSERDKGIYDAMNKGTAMAVGDYVVYLNGGDYFASPDVLATVKELLLSSGKPELCYAGCNYRFEDGSTHYRGPKRLETYIRHGVPAMHQATFYRREFLEVPPYDLKYPVSADYSISATCYMKGATACYLDRSIADFGVGGNSMQKSNKSLLETWAIQRDILKLGLLPRCWSAGRRYVAFQVLKLLHSRRSARQTPAAPQLDGKRD